ncbi:MAG TPA: diguanylate cyclase [Vicinamibacterales bacterium]|nr:diguanylate cyclase [Vicinamibacterales bacterium]
MGVVGHRDRTLIGGLAVALIVIFARPIEHYAITFAREAEGRTGLALAPALLILTLVYIFHEQRKRQDARAEALAAEALAHEAEARAGELERLVNFGESLARSLDLESVRDVVVQQLPRIIGSTEMWVLLRTGGHWQPFDGSTAENRRALERAHEKIADGAFGPEAGAWRTDPITTDGHLCVPLIAGGEAMGVLGIPQGSSPGSEAGRRIIATASAMLAIALRNVQLFHELRENSLRDGLTGCFNRTHALDVIDVELRRARRSQTPVTMIMFDLDHFKNVNDHYGHLCGDAVLAAVGNRMRDVLRGSDLKCRYGGEEFLVLLPETPIEGGKRVADSLRREIEDMTIAWKDETLHVTASFGVTVALPSEVDSHAMIARADAALYRAKDQGRNCVRLSAETAAA